MKEWALPLAEVGAEASILPEGGVFGEPTGAGVVEPGAGSSAVTESSGEMMDEEVGQGDQATLLLPEAVLPVRHEVRVQSMKKFRSGAGSVAQKPAVRPMRVIWPLQTRRHPHTRKECSPRSLLLPHHQGRRLHQLQPASPLPGVAVSSLQEGCHHAGAEGEGDPLLLFAQAGALQLSPWFQRNLQPVLCPQVRSLRKRS
jgi:hypothetical protein